MKFLFSLLLCASCLSAFSAERVTVTLAVTNAAGTTNGQTVQIIAGDNTTRTWTNSVSIASSQILTNNSAAGAATNLYTQLITTPPLGIAPIVMGASTNVLLYGQAGVTLTVNLSAGWGTVSYATQAVGTAYSLRIPYSVESAAQQTNLATGLVDWLNLAAPTNQVNQSAPAFAQFAGLTNAQTFTGPKFFNTTNTVMSQVTSNLTVTNAATINNLSQTNGANFGSAFRSPGTGLQSEQFGYLATATNDSSAAFGYGATAWGISSTAIGALAQATAQNSAAFGQGAAATGDEASAIGNTAAASGQASIALGSESIASGFGSTALGVQAVVDAAAPQGTAVGATATVGAGHTNSTAIGYSATTTKKNQVMLGSSDQVVTIPGSIEHLVTTGTNSFSDIAFRRYAISSLANGNNAGVIVGTNTFVSVSGPTAAFAINGLTGSPSRDGELLILVNLTGYDMTIAHDSGTDPVAANRIYTMTGADRATSGNGAATFIYSAAASRWLLINFDP